MDEKAQERASNGQKDSSTLLIVIFYNTLSLI